MANIKEAQPTEQDRAAIDRLCGAIAEIADAAMQQVSPAVKTALLQGCESGEAEIRLRATLLPHTHITVEAIIPNSTPIVLAELRTPSH